MSILPFYIYAVFGLTVLSAILLIYKATNYSKSFLILISLWMIFQTILTVSGFYKIANTIPPRFALLVLPPFIVILTRFFSTSGRHFIDNLDIKTLTLVHVLRVPIEIILYWLFANKMMPELLTFEGRNFDLFSGLTAVLIYYFAFVKKILNVNTLLVWNYICLVLLMNIAGNAMLSLPSVFQQFARDLPAIAILQFPFVFLPSVLVPIVLLSHLAAIRQLVLKKRN